MAAPAAQARMRLLVRHQRLGPAKGLAAAAATAGLLVPAELVLRPLAPGRRTPLPWLFHRGLSRALGIRITAHGQPARRQRVLYVCNHLSWSDIPVLGARIRGASFIAKSEVSGWGVVGRLADLGRTVYVERERRVDVRGQRDDIAARLARGDSLILFPEGTNSDGVSVLPFKSALFAVADGVEDVLIQPVSLAYTRINGLPVTRRTLPELAWVGDTELMPHALDFMALGTVRAELLFHAPVRPEDFGNRKALARHCQRQVADGYRRLMRVGG
jgi:1-acyl-sn-glycerol-3-phosphate acyltransferase